MNRKGYVAAVLFCSLSLGGILALLEQGKQPKQAAHGMRSMNVSAPESPLFEEVIPATIEKGARFSHSRRPIPATKSERPPSKSRPSPPKRLTLR